jgi:hypothetical protein
MHPRLQQVDGEVKAAREQLSALESRWDDVAAECVLEALAAGAGRPQPDPNETDPDEVRWAEEAAAEYEVPTPDPADLVFGSWDCAKSPTTRCVYDQEADPALDNCLFCHDPDERK